MASQVLARDGRRPVPSSRDALRPIPSSGASLGRALATKALVFILISVVVLTLSVAKDALWPAPVESAHYISAPSLSRSLMAVESRDQCSTKLDLIPGLAIPIYLLAILWIFVALHVLCDHYFIFSLEAISLRLNLSHDIAGATFMAVGSSAPELVANMVDTFGTNNNIGVGTIVGSAVFNVLFGLGASALVGSGQKIGWRSLLRDNVYFFVCTSCVLAFFPDGVVTWYESLILVLIYLTYLLHLAFNQRIEDMLCKRKNKNKVQQPNLDRRASMSLTEIYSLRSPPRPSSSITLELQAVPEPLQYPELGVDKDHASASDNEERESVSGLHDNDNTNDTDNDNDNNDDHDNVDDHDNANDDEQREGSSRSEQTSGKPEAPEQDLALAVAVVDPPSNDGAVVSAPRGGCGLCLRVLKGLYFIAQAPLTYFLFRFSVPQCNTDATRNRFPLTFTMCILWIIALCWVMVACAEGAGCLLELSPVLMGATFLAIGTSIPDCLSSVAASRNGMAEMSVANALGSNVFDLAFGIGFPWLLSNIARPTVVIRVSVRDLLGPVVLLFSTGIIFTVVLKCFNWRLKKRAGVVLLVLYGVFFVATCVSELIRV